MGPRRTENYRDQRSVEVVYALALGAAAFVGAVIVGVALYLLIEPTGTARHFLIRLWLALSGAAALAVVVAQIRRFERPFSRDH